MVCEDGIWHGRGHVTSAVSCSRGGGVPCTRGAPLACMAQGWRPRFERVFMVTGGVVTDRTFHE